MRERTTISRAVLSVLVVISVLTLFTSACWTRHQEPGSATPVRIGWQVSWATQGQLAQVLQHTNALSLLGLKGDFKSFTYGAPLSEAALANELDVAFIGDQPAINLISKSADWKLVGRLMDFRVAIVVPPDSSIKTVADLKGKTLGIPFGASTHRFALQALQEVGLDPTKDLTILNIDIQEQGDIIRSAGGKQWPKVDAFASWDHHIAIYESKGLAKILKSGTALGVIAMSEKFIKANPEAAVNFLAAFKLACFYYATHQEQADKWFADLSKGQFDLALLRDVASIEPNLKAPNIQSINIALQENHVSTLQSAADFAYQQRLIQTAVDIRKAINNELARDADGKITGDIPTRLTVVQ